MRCDDEALARDRDQLLAEAVVRFRNGERWWFDDDNQAKFNEVVEERSVDDPAALKIQRWLAAETRQVGTRPPRTEFTLLDVAESALGMSVIEGRKHTKSIAEAMRAAGMVKVEGRSGGKDRKRYWRYTPPPQPEQEAPAAPRASHALGHPTVTSSAPN